MNSEKILPDDPRLTAYALDEMGVGERVEFEQLLAQDEAAQAAVAEIREAGALLTNALVEEPVITGAPAKPVHDYEKKFEGFPYWKVSGLAAACFAVGFVIWQQNYVPPLRKQLIEVPLGSNESHQSPAAVAPAPVGAPSSEFEQFEIPKSIKEAARQASADFRAREPKSVRMTKATNGYMGSAGGNASRVTFKEFSSVYGGMTLAVGRDVANAETYAQRTDNGYQRVVDQPLSTFSVDVDSASYANVRRMLVAGSRPPADAVRIEEMVNYFPYASYRAPTDGAPFSTNLEVAGAPWAPEHRLVRIGLKGREITDATRPAANLVFLLDVSGSMNAANKLPLLQKSLRLLVDKLRPDDRVAIAVYAGSTGLVLPSTTVRQKAEILEAITHLRAGGSTNGGMGIHLAYDIAKANFVTGGVNRVILATDGDFNVGVTGEGELVRLIEEKAKSGVFLSVLGFGAGNLKDGTLEQLADKGNGNYAYIDTLQEARKALVEQAGGTLVTIAKDVKLQVEFNPAVVQAYRLIGYENRLLEKEDFNNDAVDAGEIGAGHTVTALYEVVPVGVTMPGAVPAVDGLKYTPVIAQTTAGSVSAEMLTVKIRYKEPAGDVSNKLEFALRDTGAAFAEASEDFKFAASVAAFGMALRDSPHRGALTLAEVSAWAREGIGSDAGGYRADFLSLVEQAKRFME
ncbi:YfbK domain-containing protein [Oleiharenicola lentus]|uniref:YfbK domain-containing protein n=1 Tax=Oleiharenicola lentus TaxID=2508720 RepID=UPI003F67D3AD